MNINFSEEQWAKTRDTYKKWWNGELSRPIMPVVITDNFTAMEKPIAPILSQANCHDFSVSAKDVILRMEYEFSKCKFLGDAFPAISFSEYGPGILAAFLGAKFDNSSGHVWFGPTDEQRKMSICDMHFEYDKNNIWMRRIKDIAEAGMDRWQGQVLFGLPDVGGVLDILVSFLTNEGLMYAMYDYPDEIKRLTSEIHNLWFLYYNDYFDLVDAKNNGYTDWSTLYSDTPLSILQCDFSYMISTDMFKEFAKPELVESCKKLSRSVYHMDGSGQISHLDEILDIDFDVFQWVPDCGEDDCSLWHSIFAKAKGKGKKIEISKGYLNEIDEVIKATNDPSCIQRTRLILPPSKEKEAVEYLGIYGI